MTPSVRHLSSGAVVFGDPERHAQPAKRDWPISKATRASVHETANAMRAWAKKEGILG